MTVTSSSIDDLMTIMLSSFDNLMTITSLSFDEFMTIKPWRRVRKFKPYFTCLNMKNLRQDTTQLCYIIQALEIQIHCTWITHQSQWGSGFSRVGCCVWALKIWRLQTALAQIPFPTTLDSSDYNFGLKLCMCRFCIRQCNSRHMTILWTGNKHAQI